MKMDTRLRLRNTYFADIILYMDNTLQPKKSSAHHQFSELHIYIECNN